MSTAEMRLATRGPFHLQTTVRVLRRRPANPLDVWDGSRYLRLLTLESGRVLTAVTNAGTVDEPDLRVALLARDPDAVVLGGLDEIGGTRFHSSPDCGAIAAARPAILRA